LSKKVGKEIIQLALIPIDEQPYEIPNNWLWVHLGSIVEINPSRNIPNSIIDSTETSFVPMTSIDELKGEVVTQVVRMYGEIKKGYTAFNEEDILFAKITPCMENGKAAIVQNLLNGFGFGSTEFHVIRAKQIVNTKFVYLLIRSGMFRNQAKAVMSGAVGQQRVPKGFLMEYPFPLPPLHEQKRIVERVESLLGRIEKAKQLIFEVKQSTNSRRTSLLFRAFSGEMTSEWRTRFKDELTYYGNPNTYVGEEPYKLPEGWVWLPFSEIAEIASNLVDPSEYKSLPHVAPDNIEKNTGVLLNYRTIEEDAVTSAKHQFKKGQIVYSKIRPYLSKVVIASFDGLCSADMYPINAKIDTNFLFRYMLSKTFLDFASNSGSRTVLPKINQKELSKIPVPVPPLEEQMEIVRIIESIISKEENSLELEGLTNSLETIVQSILSKALRGELGTNDPEEESVLELLKQIQGNGTH
jgi:type I restriction enzyme S subunit